MDMIDFSQCPIDPMRMYSGMNSQKIGITYSDAPYMLKIPPVDSAKEKAISEYLGCKIFSMLGMETQEVLFGTYTDKKGEEHFAAACKDFTADDKILYDFKQIKNTCINVHRENSNMDLSFILACIEDQRMIDVEKLRRFFWDVFVIDALIANPNRSNDNWGLLVNQSARTADIAPVFDCGSCLYPELHLDEMKYLLSSEKVSSPTSAIQENGQRISYHDYIFSGKNEDCTQAVSRIRKKIDMSQIETLIETIPLKSIAKEFYLRVLHYRKTNIIDG